MDSMITSIEKLNANNYINWSFKIKVYLKAKGWLNVLNDDPPAANAEQQVINEWNKKDAEVLNVIVQSINMEQTIYVLNETTARGAWNQLAEVHQGDVQDRKIALRRDLANSAWRKDDDVNKYISRIEALGASLATLGDVLSKAELSSYILNGLPNEYMSVKRIYEAMKPNEITPKQIRNSLISEETRKSEKCEDTKAYKINSRQKIVVCFFCGRKGHLQKDCWKKAGTSFKNKGDTKFSRNYQNSSKYKGNIEARKRVNKVHENKSDDENVVHYAYSVNHERKRNNANVTWAVDSGATCHITNDPNILEDYKEKDCGNITVADGTPRKTMGVGNITLQTNDNCKYDRVTIKNIVCVPEIDDNLLSVSKLDDAGLEIRIQNGICKIYDDTELIFIAEKINGLYRLNSEFVRENDTVNMSRTIDTDILWHKRFGHLHYDTLIRMYRNELVRGLLMKNNLLKQCEQCVLGKGTRENFKFTNRLPRENILELIHVDIFGPITPISLGFSKYVMCIVDDCSRKVNVFFLKHKSEASTHLKRYICQSENMTERKVKAVRTDNGGEFTSKDLEKYFIEKGIKHETTIPETPEQNGIAERMNRTLIDTSRTMLIESGLPKSFWAESVATAAYIRNRCATKALNNITPQEIWTGKKPTVSHLRIFGALAYAWIPKQHRQKFDAKTTPSIMVGYYENKQAYRLYDPQKKTFFASKKPIFFEERKGTELLQNEERRKTTNSDTISVQESLVIKEHTCEEQERRNETSHRTLNNVLEESENENEVYRNQENDNQEAIQGQENLEDGEQLQEHRNTENECEERRLESEENRRSNRIRNKPDRLVVQPKLKSYCNLSKGGEKIPSNFKEAISGKYKEEWIKSMDEEMKSHKKMETWRIIKKESNMNVLKSKWVYVLKNNPDGVKYKSRLVANGYFQKKGLNYFETYSPVLKLASLRIILATANKYNMILKQMDVKTAYLHGKLNEDVYMELPEGYYGDISRKDYVCKLEKSLYGLKQSGREWNFALDSELKNLNFKRLESDRCVYVRRNDTGLIILGVYVDDFCIAASNDLAMANFVDEIKGKFDTKDLGEPNIILGLRITRDKEKGTISIDQENYIDELLEKYHMENAKGIKTPMETGLYLEKTDEPLRQEIPYQSLVGALMFLVQGTRPDIAFAVHYLSQFSTSFDTTHWKHLKRILRYLIYTKNFKLTFGSEHGLKGYTDANWNTKEDGKSTSGYIYLLHGGAITWSSRKQQIIAMSTCEAEYVALCDAMKEGKWIKNLFEELEIEFSEEKMNKLLIYCDNQSALSIAKNGVNTRRTKHMSLKYLYARKEIEDGHFELKYIPSNQMLADGLTKPLPAEKLAKINNAVGFVT